MTHGRRSTIAQVQVIEAVPYGPPLKAAIAARWVQIGSHETAGPLYRRRTAQDIESEALHARLDAEDEARKEREYRNSFIGRGLD